MKRLRQSPRESATIETGRRSKMMNATKLWGTCCSFGKQTTKMQTTHRSVRKTVSLLLTLLLTFAIFSSCSAATDTFTYDANGNMLNCSCFVYEYNDANQLVKIINESDSSTVAEYFYDSDGQRVKKVEDGVTTYYIGDYVETRVSGGTVDNTSYYFANNERVARKDPDGAMYYYHGDHLGSTSVVTDETGAQSEKVSYYPYGSVKEQVGEGSNYLFTDQEFDDESGLYYYGARYYDPELTRFTQPDTIIPDTYNPQNLNRYAYVLNNPLKYTDPSGNVVIVGSLFVLLVVGGVAAEFLYCYNNPIDSSDPGDLVNIWVEGGKGMVVASASYVSGGLSNYLGGGITAQSMTAGFGGKVAENVLAGKENMFEGTPESTFANVVSSSVVNKLPLKTHGRLPGKVSSMLNPTKNAQRIWAQEITQYAVGEVTEEVINYVSESGSSDQYSYEFSPIEYYNSPYYNPEYPYGFGADAGSYTATTGYNPYQELWRKK